MLTTLANRSITYHRDNLFTRDALLDLRYLLFIILVIRVIVRFDQPSPQLHQCPRTQAVKPFPALLEPPFVDQSLEHIFCLDQRQALPGAALSSPILSFPSVCARRFGVFHGLHRVDSHDLMPFGIMSLEHGVKHPLQETDLIRGMDGSQLADRVTGRIDERINTLPSGLMIGTSYLEIKSRDLGIGS